MTSLKSLVIRWLEVGTGAVDVLDPACIVGVICKEVGCLSGYGTGRAWGLLRERQSVGM